MSRKYPKTLHLPFSPGRGKDDRVLDSVDHLLNVKVVVTEKLDGSNLCMTCTDVFARSHAGPPVHPSFDMAKSVHASVKHAIPEGFSVFGEWVYAIHSIEYDSLPSYFFLFGVREDSTQEWMDWDLVEVMASEMGMPTAPVLFEGQFKTAKELEITILSFSREASAYGSDIEGIVIRNYHGFTDFEKNVAKFVRAGHIQTDEHWKHQTIRRNRLGLTGQP